MSCCLLLYGIGRDQTNIQSNISFFKEIDPNIEVIYHYIKIEKINNKSSNEIGYISYDNIEFNHSYIWRGESRIALGFSGTGTITEDITIIGDNNSSLFTD